MLNFDELLPEGVWLYPHQVCGVATALLERRLILGDQMGLGKSAQALVAIEAAKAYPAVIACPASLVADWAGEIEYFLPQRRVQAASGAPLYWGADVVVVSYSLLHEWARLCVEDIAPRAVVLDESHYCSNLARRRSRAALALSASVREDGLVLALTGAPLLNKPADVIAQLKLIGRFDSFLDRAGTDVGDEAPEAIFNSKWCRDLTSQRQLHRALCQSCYVRRARKDVANNEGSRRNVVLLSVALESYQQAEARLVARLARGAQERLAEPAEGDAEALGQLRRLVGEAKVRAAAQWVSNYLDSNPGRDLVAFVQHRSVGEQLAQQFGCPYFATLGGPSPEGASAEGASPEGGVASQEPRAQDGRRRQRRLVVAGPTNGANSGTPLAAARDAVFIELGWSLDEHDPVALATQGGAGGPFVWYLLAAGTIDLAVLASLEARRVGEGPGSGLTQGDKGDRAWWKTAADVLADLRQRLAPTHDVPRPASKVVPLRRRYAG